MRQRIHSTSRTILVSFALILVLVIAMFAYMAWKEYQRAEKEKRDLVTSRVQIVSTHAEWLMGASRQALKMVDLMAGSQFPDLTADTKVAISDIVAGLPGSANLN